MDKILYLRDKFVVISLYTFFFAFEAWSQIPSVYVPQQGNASEPVEDNTWYYITLFILFVGLLVAVYWWHTTKNAISVQHKQNAGNQSRQFKGKANSDSFNADDSFDIDKEIDWLRKNRTIKGKENREASIKNDKFSTDSSNASGGKRAGDLAENTLEIKYEDLPVNSFTEIRAVKEYEALPVSNESNLLDAIEISQDELEEDEKVREIALRVLESFKTRNAAECLGQMALYDLSANLRSKAAASLADLDHESVFEDILLACADPTREVRASAARGLFRLSFDRADAWARIAESNDEYRMRQAAQAASEAGLIERTFDRLTHTDQKIAYEAFTFTALLIKAGETEKIFDAIENHRDNKVKIALLQVLKVVKDEATLPNLYTLIEQNSIPAEIKDKVDEVIQAFGLVAV